MFYFNLNNSLIFKIEFERIFKDRKKKKTIKGGNFEKFVSDEYEKIFDRIYIIYTQKFFNRPVTFYHWKSHPMLESALTFLLNIKKRPLSEVVVCYVLYF